MFPGDVLRNPAELSAAGKVRCKNPEKCREKRIGAEWKGEGKMLSICRSDCCSQCGRSEECGGCIETGGHPFGGMCVAAEWIDKAGYDGFLRRKKALIDEFNALGIEYLQVTDLNLLNGFYVNLEYRLPNGRPATFLKDNDIYWGNQIAIPESDRCYGIIADSDYLLVCEYGERGEDPQVVVYKRREHRE